MERGHIGTTEVAISGRSITSMPRGTKRKGWSYWHLKLGSKDPLSWDWDLEEENAMQLVMGTQELKERACEMRTLMLVVVVLILYSSCVD